MPLDNTDQFLFTLQDFSAGIMQDIYSGEQLT